MELWDAGIPRGCRRGLSGAELEVLGLARTLHLLARPCRAEVCAKGGGCLGSPLGFSKLRW